MTSATNGFQEKIYDTIVLGSGAGGMTAALAAARKGNSVLVLEAGKAFGGMLNPFARKKYHFDIGIHYIGECGPRGALRRTLDFLGLEDLRFNEINPDGFDRYVFPGYEGLLVKGIDRWGDWLCSQYPAETDAIRKFMELMKATESVMRMGVRGPSVADAKRVAAFPLDIIRTVTQPLSVLLDQYFKDPHLKNVFAGPGGDLGLPPSQVSAFGSILLLTHYLGGAYYPIGGTTAYRDAYLDGLEKAGAELKRNQEVVEIRVNRDQTFTIRTAAEQSFRGRTVVSNIDAADTVPLITGEQPNWLTRRRAAKSRPSLGSVCVFLGTDIDLTQTQVTDANIWHYGSEDIDGSYKEVQEGRFPEKPFFFLTAPTLKDPSGHKAPAGHHTLEIITMAPTEPFRKWMGKDEKTMKRGAEYDNFKNELGDKLIAEVERLYVPGLSKHITIKEVSTPATNVSFVRARNGGIYGPELTPDQATFRRFFPSTGIPGLYFAGASVLGGGVMPCTMSGMIAANLVQKELKVRKSKKIVVPQGEKAPLEKATA